jgi:hypothetical protein
MPDVGQPTPPRLEVALGTDIVAELNVLSSVETEPTLLERVLDLERVWRHVLEQSLQASPGVTVSSGGGRRGVESAGEHATEHLEHRRGRRSHSSCGGGGRRSGSSQSIIPNPEKFPTTVRLCGGSSGQNCFALNHVCQAEPGYIKRTVFPPSSPSFHITRFVSTSSPTVFGRCSVQLTLTARRSMEADSFRGY